MTMINRLVLVSYVLTAGWAALWGWGMLQSGTQYLTAFVIFGLSPLGLLLLIRYVSVGRP